MKTQAELVLGPNEAYMKKPGDYVACAISGQKIPLENLRYWDVESQQPFFSPEQALQFALKNHQNK